MQYEHTQRGGVTKLSLLGGASICVVVAVTGSSMPTVAHAGLYVMAVLFLFLSWLFGSLTVRIDTISLQHWFGPGFWNKSYQLQDIESVEIVRNCWIYGWGIRLTPHGWLYNVSGLDAVQVQVRSGRKFRIGTDDPQGLFDAITENIP